MIRQPSFETTVETLTKQFKAMNANYTHQGLLNLVAQVHGYKNYAHYKAETDRMDSPAKATAASVPSAPQESTPSREAKLEIALNWVVVNFESVLARHCVRDVDECLSHAKLLLKPSTL